MVEDTIVHMENDGTTIATTTIITRAIDAMMEMAVEVLAVEITAVVAKLDMVVAPMADNTIKITTIEEIIHFDNSNRKNKIVMNNQTMNSPEIVGPATTTTVDTTNI